MNGTINYALLKPMPMSVLQIVTAKLTHAQTYLLYLFLLKYNTYTWCFLRPHLLFVLPVDR